VLRQIGVVKQVQVQRASLKVGQKPLEVYDPAALRRVDGLRLSPLGVIGLLTGEEIVDVHNALHPQSKNGGVNGISVGFTSHYAAMRQRFGPHLIDGIAGENILVEVEGPFVLEAMGGRLIFQKAATGEQVVVEIARAAAPCEPFSRFALQQGPPVAPEVMKATLQFLGGGTRGFYASAQGGVISSGDKVFVGDS
jgi:hypothetical protein